VLEEREKLRALKLESLRAEIQRGINSGPGQPIEDVAHQLKVRYQQWTDKGAPADAL
jgi:antitoxin ParD1/3/4